VQSCWSRGGIKEEGAFARSAWKGLDRASGEQGESLWSGLSSRDKMGAYLGLVWYSPSQTPSTACLGRGAAGGVAGTQHG